MFVMNDVFTLELVQMKLLLLFFKLKFFSLSSILTHIYTGEVTSFASFCNLIAIKKPSLHETNAEWKKKNWRWKFMRIMDMDSSDKILVVFNILIVSSQSHMRHLFMTNKLLLHWFFSHKHLNLIIYASFEITYTMYMRDESYFSA